MEDSRSAVLAAATAQTMDEEAVTHALRARVSADFAWRHLEAEYTQDMEKVLDTLARNQPLTWTLPQMVSDDGTFTYLAGQTIDEIRDCYKMIRDMVEIWGWEPIVELRQGWYMMTHGIVTLKSVSTGQVTRSQTVTMFPAGADGILGEVQIGNTGARTAPPLRDAGNDPYGVPLPGRRIEARTFHDAYIDAFRREDVSALVAANRHDGANAIRNYLTDRSSVLTTSSAEQLGAYYKAFFEKYAVRDVQLVNRVAESWYLFAELHWTVEERAGERRTLQFCTAETAPLDEHGRYWLRTGSGTDPVAV